MLPRGLLNQLFDIAPELNSLISHTLCREELQNDQTYVYKDLSLIAFNRNIIIDKEFKSEPDCPN